MPCKGYPTSLVISLTLSLLGGCGDDTGSLPPVVNNVAPVEQKTATQDKASQLITANSVGKAQLGMTPAELLAAFPGATSSTTRDGEGVTWMTLVRDGETLMSVFLDETTRTAGLIRVLSPQFATAEGVKVGENLQSAADKLGGLNEIQWTEIESREFATFKNGQPSIQFQVVGSNGTAGFYANQDMVTAIASPSATIQSIWVMED